MNLSPLGSSEHIAQTEPRPTTPLKRDGQEFHQIERSLAYSSCEQEIRSACHTVEEADLATWYDLDSADEFFELGDAVAYLDARGLLEHHPQNARWVMIRDEDVDPIDVLAAHPAQEPQGNCAQDMVKAKRPQARVVRGVFGLVVQDDDTGQTLGDGRMPAYWHEEAWMNAVEEVEGR